MSKHISPVHWPLLFPCARRHHRHSVSYCTVRVDDPRISFMINSKAMLFKFSRYERTNWSKKPTCLVQFSHLSLRFARLTSDIFLVVSLQIKGDTFTSMADLLVSQWGPCSPPLLQLSACNLLMTVVCQPHPPLTSFWPIACNQLIVYTTAPERWHHVIQNKLDHVNYAQCQHKIRPQGPLRHICDHRQCGKVIVQKKRNHSYSASL